MIAKGSETTIYAKRNETAKWRGETERNGPFLQPVAMIGRQGEGTVSIFSRSATTRMEVTFLE
jgi:hypothetical protein